MKPSSNLKTMLLLASFALAGLTQAQTVTISDNTFSLSNWQLTGLQGSNVNTASASVIGGLSGNGRMVTITGFGQITYQVENYKTNAGFSPSLGTITGIDSEIWAIYNGSSTYQQIRFIAKQGNGFYIAPTSWSPPNQSSFWQKDLTTSVSPASYGLFRGTGPSTLDLSPSGQTIYFGYMTYTPVFIPSPANIMNSFFVTTVHYDPVPEPTAAVACLVGVAALIRRKRQR